MQTRPGPPLTTTFRPALLLGLQSPSHVHRTTRRNGREKNRAEGGDEDKNAKTIGGEGEVFSLLLLRITPDSRLVVLPIGDYSFVPDQPQEIVKTEKEHLE